MQKGGSFAILPTPMRNVLSILAIVAVLTAPAAFAHKVTSVSLVTHLDTKERTYLLDAAMEVVPSEDAEVNEQIPPEAAAREFAEEYLNILFDEEDQTPELSIELVNASDEETPEGLERQQVVTQMKGTIPKGAREFLLYLEPTCPMAVVMVVIKDEKPSRRMQVILAGEYSRPVEVSAVEEGDPFVEEEKATEENAPVATEPEASESDGGSAFVAGWNSVFRGSWLPLAVVVATFLLTTRGRWVFYQFAVLLIPLSAVVALRAWEVIPAPKWAPMVLALLLIAISLEAIFHYDLRWWRLVAIALAGAFAGLVLSQSIPFRMLFSEDAAIDTVEVILSLVGIEAALVLVAVIAASVLLFLNRYSWYRNAVVQPLAALLAGYGLFAQIERFL